MNQSLTSFKMGNVLLWITTGILVLPVSFYTGMLLVNLVGLNEDVYGIFIMLPLALVLLTVGQWLILRGHIADAHRWIWASFSGWIACIGVMFALSLIAEGLFSSSPPDNSLLPLIPVFVFGVTVGAMQWRVVKKYVPNVLIWISLQTIGLLIAFFSIGESISNVYDMAMIGGFPAAITGLGLLWYVKKPENVKV